MYTLATDGDHYVIIYAQFGNHGNVGIYLKSWEITLDSNIMAAVSKAADKVAKQCGIQFYQYNCANWDCPN